MPPEIEGIVWPPIHFGELGTVAAMAAEIDRCQWLTPADLAAGQARQLAALTQYHAAHTPSFMARLAAAGLAAGDLGDLAGLRRLAPISRRDVQSAGDALFADPAPPSHHPLSTVKTSGSTGEPVAIRKSAVTRLYWLALTVREMLWRHRNFNGRLSSIRAQIDQYFESPDWGTPVRELYASGPAQAIPITTDIGEQLKLLRRFQPNTLLIYPSNLAAFAAVWEQSGFDLPGLNCIMTLGETLPPELRARAERLTGLTIADNYSSQEAGPIAMQCPASDFYHVMAESLIVEVLDAAGAPCAEGQVGRVVLTDLHNFASALIRYDIGDYAEVGGPCPCGRGLPTLTRVLGRERNLLRRADGTRHWPLFGSYDFKDVVLVRQYQFVQHSLTDLEFKVVTDAELTDAEAAGLIEIVRRHLGSEFQIRITQSRTRLPLAANGKFEEFICKIA